MYSACIHVHMTLASLACIYSKREQELLSQSCFVHCCVHAKFFFYGYAPIVFFMAAIYMYNIGAWGVARRFAPSFGKQNKTTLY